MVAIFFYFLAALIVSSAVCVVALRNPIYSALALVLNLFSVAGIFALLNAHFLAAVQVIVYAGAIVVLVLFVLMLLNLKLESPKRLSLSAVVLSIATGIAFLATVIPIFEKDFSAFNAHQVSNVGNVASIGQLLYTRYVFPFEAASLLIMAAIVGAVMLSKRNYREKTK